MAETGITYRLVTPLGELKFNQYQEPGYLHMQNVTGLDAAKKRSDSSPKPQRDGIDLYATFDGARTPVLEGDLIFETLAQRSALETDIRKHCDAIKNADGTLFWPPTGKPERKLTVRLNEEETITSEPGKMEKGYMIPLIAPDPRIYSVQSFDSYTGFVSPGGGGGLVFPLIFNFTFTTSSGGGLLTINYGGEANAWPIVRIYGTISNPTILNNTLGKRVRLKNTVITAPDYIEINMLEETIKKNGTGDSLDGLLDIAVSEFWPLSPLNGGVNDIHLFGDAPDPATARAQLLWSNVYA